MLVSCVLPTWNRNDFIPSAIRCFLAQDYPDLELIIVDSGDDDTRHVIPRNEPRIKYVHSEIQLPCGAARNLGTEYAKGELILNTDSDDWYHPQRVSRQVDFHMKSGMGVSGYSYIVMHNVDTDDFNRYTMPDPYTCGPSIVYSKSYWLNVDKIEPINEGEDTRFVKRAADRNEVARNYDDSVITIVARTHNGNTVSRDPLYCTPQWVTENKPDKYEYDIYK
jgi:glycosyltransferase involved in cell wall biosynthesis